MPTADLKTIIRARNVVTIHTGACNYEMINTSDALQRQHPATFEIRIVHFVVSCSPGYEHELVDRELGFMGLAYLNGSTQGF